MTESSTFSEAVVDRRPPRYYEAVRRYFRTHSTAVATLDDLAATIGDERDEPQRRVAIRLHHVTLPKLADAGVLDYDGRTNTARYRGDDGGDVSGETEG